MRIKKDCRDEFIRVLNSKVGALYSDTVNHFSFEEKLEILGNPKIEYPKPPVYAGMDFKEAKINEMFSDRIRQFVKTFYYTSNREKSFDTHLSKDSQKLYLLIWRKSEIIYEKKGKKNNKDAARFALREDNPFILKTDIDRHYSNFKKFMWTHKIKSLSDFNNFLVTIGSNPK
jgi:hypothetical protein